MLIKRLDCDVSNVGNVVASCVVLHNVCQHFGDECLPEWVESPSSIAHCCSQEDGNTVGRIRDAIASYATPNYVCLTTSIATVEQIY